MRAPEVKGAGGFFECDYSLPRIGIHRQRGVTLVLLTERRACDSSVLSPLFYQDDQISLFPAPLQESDHGGKGAR
jgi:hypothetical protein